MNNQQNLFAVIDRSYETNQRPIDERVMHMGHINLIQERSDANYIRPLYNQLDITTHLGCIGKANSQRSELTDPIIKCTPRYNETSSRFNYAYDSQITARPTEISGINIPNNQLRIIPNRGTQLSYQKTIMPKNQEIYNLSQNLIRISNTNGSMLDNQNLQLKASRERLTREELLGLAKI
jgi:hypothetical protein